jgi:hypothetical protein
MALQKEIVLSNGVDGNYLKIDSYQVNRTDNSLSVRLSLFKSVQYKDTKPINGAGKEYTFINLTKEQLEGDVVALGYALIKAKNDPDLAGATDV